MKKNVRFSFLDFSTLAKRKYFCERELHLNQRLAPDLYEEVVAVNPVGAGLLVFGPYQANSVGYAVRMRRVDKQWEMRSLLERAQVTVDHIDRIARQLASFHQRTDEISVLFNPIRALDDFADIEQYQDALLPFIGIKGIREVKQGGQIAKSFLRRHHQRFHYRAKSGFTLDGHGDLHTGNIFLENDQPIIFDCVEFNDDFRHVDVLDEVAFLYLDLEANGHLNLADRLVTAYQSHYRVLLKEVDERLFDYYKCYRANVRLKVIAIKIDNLKNEAEATTLISRLHRYYELYRKYAARLLPQETKTAAISSLTAEEGPSTILLV